MKSQSSTYQYEEIFNGLPQDFETRALEVFKSQYLGNKLYRRFADRFRANLDSVKELTQIPFLPVSFFKTDEVKNR